VAEAATVTQRTCRLHLASASPRRRDILTQLGLEFSQSGVDIDESRQAGEHPASMVVRLAETKARTAASALADDSVVIGADTAVVLGDEVYGKPADEAMAVNMLLRLSGEQHEVMTGVAVLVQGELRTALSRSKVRFRDIDAAEAAAYWQSGEPLGKAGGYAIQGLGALFAGELRGSYTGVVGLPVFETAALLAEAGIDPLRLSATTTDDAGRAP